MGGVMGNDNLAYIRNYQYVDFTNASEQSAALDKRCAAVDLYATEDCYITIASTDNGPVAAAPGAESTSTQSFRLITETIFTVAVPLGSDVNPTLIAVIRVTTDGRLDIHERSFS